MFKNLFGKPSEMPEETYQLYDVYISYSTKDMKAAELFKNCLQKRGVTVRFGLSGINPGEDIGKATMEAIAGSKIFVPLITNNSIGSRFFLSELYLAVHTSDNRSKSVLPVSDVLEGGLPAELKFRLGKYQIICVNFSNAREIEKAAGMIADYIGKKSDDGVKLEKFISYSKAGIKGKACDLLCDIIEDFCDELTNSVPDREAMLKLLSYTQKLEELYDYDYSAAGRSLARKKLNTIGKIESALGNAVFMRNAYNIAIAIKIIYSRMLIHIDIADAMTGGDVSDGIVNMTDTKRGHIEFQEPYIQKYNELKSDLLEFNEEDRNFILDAQNYMCRGTIKQRSFVNMSNPEPSAEGEDLLKAVAKFMQEGNKIFDMIGDEKPAREFLKCLITSYERLKSYSEVVGADEICGECIEKIAELKQKLTKISLASSTDERAENGIKSLLGLSVPKSGEFDVFISHKTEDFDLAVDMYEFLKENLKEAFLDKYTLPEMSEAKYKKSIMDALEGSKHFVVLFSNLEYLESKWVALEMELFLTEKDEGRKTGNFLIVVTDDVYDEIMASDKKALSIEYRRFEIIRFKDYKKVLLNYLGR